jgi:asparagine synthase (glutamine-hydrolysing)
MCGLVGGISWATPRNFDAECLERALDSIQARGPDGRGIWKDENAVLGHLRLAVIDLSERAAQPMASSDGRYLIIYNGEIYNFEAIKTEIGNQYCWASDSDTEVILAAYIKWGAECLSKFHGMFAFAIWDREQKALFLARDRVGVKPLYYHAGADVFAFASRPRALYSLMPDLSPEFDRQAIRYYLESGYIPAPFSCHKEIRKLEPGHYLLVTAAGIRKCCYWSLDAIASDESRSHLTEAQLIDELDVIIDEAVRMRMVSNVPIGAFLSGGIDSSLVVAYMKKHATGPLSTFTIGFEDGEFDESRHAQAVADHLGTKHICERLAPQDLLALMPTYLSEYDEPFFDYSAFPVMAVSRLARRHVTVSLSGDGGDEAFGGYHYYRIAQKLSLLQAWPPGVRKGMSWIASKLPGHKLSLLGAALAAGSDTATFAFMRSVVKDFADVMTPEFRAETTSMAALFETRRRAMPASLSAAEAGMRLDLAYTLPDDYLQKVDVGSMAFSLEAREPLLDHTILEWAAGLPIEWKLRGKTNKYLLRQLAYRYVPRSILDRPKMGFGVPMERWLKAELRPWAENLLADRESMEAVGLDYHAVIKLWEVHQSGTRQAHTCLWTVLILLQYYRNFLSANEPRH